MTRLAEKSPSRRERFEQLFSHKDYLALFDAFVNSKLEGLFGGFRASVIHEMIPDGCETVG